MSDLEHKKLDDLITAKQGEELLDLLEERKHRRWLLGQVAWFAAIVAGTATFFSSVASLVHSWIGGGK